MSCFPKFAKMSRTVDDLFDALRRDDLEFFRSLLLTYGFPKNSEWSDYHLLSEAINLGHKEIANFLLDLKCRVSKPGTRRTLVHVALTYSDWSEQVMKLINLGASVSTVNAAGDTAVHVAFKNNTDGDLIDLLLSTYVKETIMNIKDKTGLSILHIACSRSNLDVVQALTYRNARVIVTHEDVNAQVQSSYSTGYSRYTPLHFAVKNGRMEIVMFLLEHFNIDIYKVEANCSTALHLALERNDIEMLDSLLAYDKVHVDNINKMGLSHFMAACAGSNSSIVAEYFLLTQHRPWNTPYSLINNKTVKIGCSPYRGYSSMHFAAEFGRLETVHLLLAHGASCFVVSAENLTPLVVALKRGHKDICRLLWRRYKAYSQATYDAMDEDDQNGVACGGNRSTELKNQVFSKLPSSADQNENALWLNIPRSFPPPALMDQQSPTKLDCSGKASQC